jgi:hypothetical protein
VSHGEYLWPRYGAAAGAIAIILYASAAIVIGDRPSFDASGVEVAAWFDEERTRIQVAVALNAATGPLLVWFLATVVSLTRTGTLRARRASAVANGCGRIFIAIFLVDVAALAAGALRPENMRANPELAAALVDFEWLAQGVAAPLGTGMLIAFGVLILRDRGVWPPWVGRLAVLAAAVYALRIGTLFTTEGAFAADGVLGLYAPVTALAGWLFVASVVLSLRFR